MQLNIACCDCCFPLFSSCCGGKLLELNLATPLEVIPNASSRYFEIGLLFVNGQADMSSPHTIGTIEKLC